MYSLENLTKALRGHFYTIKSIVDDLGYKPTKGKYRFEKADAERIADEYVKKYHAHLFGIAPSIDIFNKIKLYTYSDIQKETGASLVSIYKVVKKLYPEITRSVDGQRHKPFFTQAEFDNISAEARQRKLIDINEGGIYVNWRKRGGQNPSSRKFAYGPKAQ